MTHPLAAATTIQTNAADLLDLAHVAGGMPAVFSCNARGEVWPYATFGLTPDRLRRHMQGQVPLLDLIVRYVLATRPGGGRFCITPAGVVLVADMTTIARFTPGGERAAGWRG